MSNYPRCGADDGAGHYCQIHRDAPIEVHEMHEWYGKGERVQWPNRNDETVEKYWGIEGVIYTVTVESPDHRKYEFTSWDSHNPYSAATTLFEDLSSESARIDEQFIRRTEPRTIRSRGYGNADPEAVSA